MKITFPVIFHKEINNFSLSQTYNAKLLINNELFSTIYRIQDRYCSKSDIKEFTNLERNLTLSRKTLINHSTLRKIYCRIWGI